MSALQWRDWSCTVRVVVADGRPATSAPAPALAAEVETAVRALMGEVERAVSRFRPDTDLLRVNAGAGTLVPVRPLTLDLVEVALEAARRTEGACDPTVGTHVLAAGYDADIDVLRTRGARPGATPERRPDWAAVRVDRMLGRIGVPLGLQLDLGSTAKAWAADTAAGRVRRGTGLAALVAIGGDLSVSGDDTDWPVVVSEHEDGAGEVVTLGAGGLATSSSRGRRWTVDGDERHHVIDPHTGLPTDGPVRTASVLAESCVLANTLSTAALVWGAEAPERLADHAARLVTDDGAVQVTASWPEGQPWSGVAA